MTDLKYVYTEWHMVLEINLYSEADMQNQVFHSSGLQMRVINYIITLNFKLLIACRQKGKDNFFISLVVCSRKPAGDSLHLSAQ